MLVQFRCCLKFTPFPVFERNYPFYPCLVVGVKRVYGLCFAKHLRSVLDYWQFENLHSLSFAIAKQLLISIFSLGRRSVRYCSLQPCQNPLCRQSAFQIRPKVCESQAFSIYFQACNDIPKPKYLPLWDNTQPFTFSFQVSSDTSQNIYPRTSTPKVAKKNEVFPQSRNCKNMLKKNTRLTLNMV